VSAPRKKLVLAVVDALKPEMLERAVEHGRAPALATLMRRGTYVRDCVSTFPSVTPVAAAPTSTASRR
jgi:predicted AlkP superfamily pyrophosphatase or phosphodiesterase